MINNNMNDEKPKKQSFIWNAEKKRPSNLAFILIIALTIIFLISGVLSVLVSFHDIKVVIDCQRNNWGDVNYGDSYNSIEPGSGLREFSYPVRKGLTISVNIFRSNNNFGSSRLTIEIYDNGDLVAERTVNDNQRSVQLEYTVGVSN